MSTLIYSIVEWESAWILLSRVKGRTQPHTLLYSVVAEGSACILPSKVKGMVRCTQAITLL